MEAVGGGGGVLVSLLELYFNDSMQTVRARRRRQSRKRRRRWADTDTAEMIRFCTKRFGNGCAASCITCSHGLNSFLFQTCLVSSGAKMVHLFR